MTPQKAQEIRVRMAPSPTGLLHVGTARTAIFNWLFARHEGGKFILRIEDTDKERSTLEFEKNIIQGLTWLGIDWDEGVYFKDGKIVSEGPYASYRQSERVEIYKKYLEQLLKEKKAYYCFCTKEELDVERESSLAMGLAPKYSGKCRNFSDAEVEERLKKGSSAIIRLKVPETTVSFTDVIRGSISFNMALMGDFSIAKSLTEPLYNFSVVIDDFEMRISHVFRGEDHIANTPKQIVLQEALGFPHPHYGHFPLILDPDRKKMSKRHSATGVEEYRQDGYLPEAIVNFLTLLGWHPTDDKEIMTKGELIQKFEIRRIQKAGAVFNLEKLNWMNAQYLKQLPTIELLEYIKERITLPHTLTDATLMKILEVTKDKMKVLSDFESQGKFFWELPHYPPQLLIWKDAPKENIIRNLNDAVGLLESIPESGFNKEAVTKAITPFAEERGRGAVLWPIRVALSGLQFSPGPFEIIDVLGKEMTLERLRQAILILNK